VRIEILGMGCSKCRNLHENVVKAAEEAGVSAEIIKVEDISKIMEYGVMITPALVINGEVRSTGKVVSVDEIKKWI